MRLTFQEKFPTKKSHFVQFLLHLYGNLYNFGFALIISIIILIKQSCLALVCLYPMMVVTQVSKLQAYDISCGASQNTLGAIFHSFMHYFSSRKKGKENYINKFHYKKFIYDWINRDLLYDHFFFFFKPNIFYIIIANDTKIMTVIWQIILCNNWWKKLKNELGLFNVNC